MDSSPQLTGKPLTGWHLLWFVVPFLVVVLNPLNGLVESIHVYVPVVPLLVLIIVLAVAGFGKGMPYWALPSVGLAIGFANLLIFGQFVGAIPILTWLKAALWTVFMPSRVLYALIADALFLLPPLLVLLLLVLLTRILPALRPFGNLLRQEWTLLPFLFYTTNLITPLVAADGYSGLEVSQLLFVLILAVGTWLYLRVSQPTVRMGILLGATLLAGLTLALGIYLVYPNQSWVNGVSGNFPRWWETLVPLLETTVRLGVLCLLARLGVALGRRARPLAATG